MTALYNENAPRKAQLLRNLIAAGHIANGYVDDRSIKDVESTELAGYGQVHLFAGAGVWSHALRLAGWADVRRAWTCSCPCQPFSEAGKGNGFDDDRHLWPDARRLIEKHLPPAIFGEQVASKAAGAWVDLVQADLEALGYAFGCVPFPSASVGAPHARDRIYWVAYSDDAQWGPEESRGDIGNRKATERHQGDRDAWQRLHGPDWKAYAASFCESPDGYSRRMVRLHAYGNAINPWQAAEFILAAEEARLTA